MQRGGNFQRRNWVLPATFLGAFFVFFIGAHINFDRGNRDNILDVKDFYARRTIVSYSLLKRIELDGRERICDVKAADNHEDIIKRRNVDLTWSIVDGTNLYLLSAHLDARLDPYHYLRMIAAVAGNSSSDIFCTFPTFDGSLISTKATVNQIWFPKWNKNDQNVYFNPVLLSCRIPFKSDLKGVSLATTACKDKGMSLNVHKNRDIVKFDGITVCVKPLHFLKDISYNLVQWIELLKVMGVSKIEFYVTRVTSKVMKILQWYTKQNSIEIKVRNFTTLTKIKDSFSKQLWQKRKYEVITYNDCFYRNIHVSRYVVPLDIDEVIVPKKELSWSDFLKNHNFDAGYASAMVPNAFYFRKINSGPKEVFFFENFMRNNVSKYGEYGKSFISTKNALTVFNHYALDVLKPDIEKILFLPSDDIHLNHYKEGCNSVILPECVKYLSSRKIKDTGILRFKEKFFVGYNRSLEAIEQL